MATVSHYVLKFLSNFNLLNFRCMENVCGSSWDIYLVTGQIWFRLTIDLTYVEINLSLNNYSLEARTLTGFFSWSSLQSCVSVWFQQHIKTLPTGYQLSANCLLALYFRPRVCINCWSFVGRLLADRFVGELFFSFSNFNPG